MQPKMSEVIITLESLFDFLNGEYFDAALPKPVITVQSNPRTYGHCSMNRIWVGNEQRYEINLAAEYLNREIDRVAATLLHEMVHLYCLENSIAATCQNGRYHNKRFKTESEARDLIIAHHAGIGYSETAPAQALADKLIAAGFDKALPIHRLGAIASAATAKPGSAENGPGNPKEKKKRKYFRYMCPKCKARVYGTKPLNLMCNDCACEMVEPEDERGIAWASVLS